MEKVPTNAKTAAKSKQAKQENEAEILSKANAIVQRQQQRNTAGFMAEYEALTKKWSVAIGGRAVILEGGRIGVELSPRPLNT